MPSVESVHREVASAVRNSGRIESPVIPSSTGLPKTMVLAVTRAAGEWFASPARPRPSPKVVRYWDALIDRWVHDQKCPLLVRKTGPRGCTHRHAGSGRVIVCTHNSPAHWTLAAAISGETPTVAQLRKALESGAWPVAFALSREDAAKRPRYNGQMRRSPLGNALNAGRWKVCHIERVSEDARGAALDSLSIENLVEHSRRFLNPSNMFLVPCTHGGLGELPEVLAIFAQRGSRRRGSGSGRSVPRVLAR